MTTTEVETMSDITDAIEALWKTPTGEYEAEIEASSRRLYGDCRCCLEHGSLEPGIASERAVWVDAGGRVGEDIYRVCPECLRAANGGPGYHRA
jgi:hypothetical protein